MVRSMPRSSSPARGAGLLLAATRLLAVSLLAARSFAAVAQVPAALEEHISKPKYEVDQAWTWYRDEIDRARPGWRDRAKKCEPIIREAATAENAAFLEMAQPDPDMTVVNRFLQSRTRKVGEFRQCVIDLRPPLVGRVTTEEDLAKEWERWCRDWEAKFNRVLRDWQKLNQHLLGEERHACHFHFRVLPSGKFDHMEAVADYDQDQAACDSIAARFKDPRNRLNPLAFPAASERTEWVIDSHMYLNEYHREPCVRPTG